MCRTRRSDVAAGTAQLALFYHEQERWEEATDYYRQALKHCDSPLVVDRLQNLLLPRLNAQIVNTSSGKRAEPGSAISCSHDTPKDRVPKPC